MSNETADEDDLAFTADHVAKSLDQGGRPSIGLDRMNARIRGFDDLLLVALHPLIYTPGWHKRPGYDLRILGLKHWKSHTLRSKPICTKRRTWTKRSL